MIKHLTDRPCAVCEFHKENGCSKWSCVFEQEPTTKNDLGVDCISRAELLKVMDTWDKFGYTETGCFTREPKGDYVPYVHYEDMVNCVKGMPSVTPQEQRWIPISERLPENKTYVLVTIGIPGRQPHARSGWYQDGFFHNDNGDCWRATDIEVKAWMPLPQAYKGVGI